VKNSDIPLSINKPDLFHTTKCLGNKYLHKCLTWLNCEFFEVRDYSLLPFLYAFGISWLAEVPAVQKVFSELKLNETFSEIICPHKMFIIINSDSTRPQMPSDSSKQNSISFHIVQVFCLCHCIPFSEMWSPGSVTHSNPHSLSLAS
jgi:hypothetical protein